MSTPNQSNNSNFRSFSIKRRHKNIDHDELSYYSISAMYRNSIHSNSDFSKVESSQMSLEPIVHSQNSIGFRVNSS
ncbi:hypothetical protein Y032_0266g707 [Ancylostoma ceylanicum]|uniref:Uncharacterized protein n=1 Tax=Ancylostoma ceylanicum TaxID=53326 RepID=A0A016S9A3_9BILA|nr:hypothetical protein Y032_0266g707 [Ancylostoma ceylanicum]